MDTLNQLLAQIDEYGRKGLDLDMLPLFEQAIAEIKQRGDLGLMARTLNDYGGVLRNTGSYDKAEEILSEALQIVEELSGKHSPAYITNLLNLGTNYLDWQQLPKAKTILMEAYELGKKINLQNLLFASICNNLGNLYGKEGNWQKAYDYQCEGIDILETKEHSQVKLALAYSNMAQSATELGKKEVSISYMNKAETLLKGALGEGHPLYANILNNLAAMYYRSGEYVKAESLLESALPLLEHTYGTQSKAYRSVEQNLGIIKRDTHKGENKETVTSEACEPTYSFRAESGMGLAYTLWKQEVKPLLERECPELMKRMAAGLLGKGSECFLYDDELSKDHDFECRVLLFLKANDYHTYGAKLESILTTVSMGNAYVIPLEDFYYKYTKCKTGPQTLSDWRAIPEDFLATATNGYIFMDALGEFSAIRENLKKYYPEDLRLKYLAYESIKFAQSGQYNYPRMQRRNDCVAASLALHEAMNHAMAIIFLLNKVYMPFYKWRYRMLKSLPILGEKASHILEKLVNNPVMSMENLRLLESLAEELVSTFNEQGLTRLTDGFLLNHGYEIFEKIQDSTLKAESPWSR